MTASTPATAEADAAMSIGAWARAAALYATALKTLPQTSRKERIEWSRVCRLQQSAQDSADFVRTFSSPLSTVRV
jgi:hypothetical protein